MENCNIPHCLYLSRSWSSVTSNCLYSCVFAVCLSIARVLSILLKLSWWFRYFFLLLFSFIFRWCFTLLCWLYSPDSCWFNLTLCYSVCLLTCEIHKYRYRYLSLLLRIVPNICLLLCSLTTRHGILPRKTHVVLASLFCAALRPQGAPGFRQVPQRCPPSFAGCEG